jgi:hypothetical protein
MLWQLWSGRLLIHERHLTVGEGGEGAKISKRWPRACGEELKLCVHSQNHYCSRFLFPAIGRGIKRDYVIARESVYGNIIV